MSMTDFGPALFLVVIGVSLFLLSLFADKRQSLNYPSISDDEFMAKLPPGTDREIALKVRTIVAEQMGVDREKIHPETRFIDL